MVFLISIWFYVVFGWMCCFKVIFFVFNWVLSIIKSVKLFLSNKIKKIDFGFCFKMDSCFFLKKKLIYKKRLKFFLI